MKGGSDKRKNLMIQYNFSDDVRADYSDTKKTIEDTAKRLDMTTSDLMKEKQEEIPLT
jgi:hypothetical protein